MGMQLVLHIGAHKTGTSLIQRYMKDHKELMNRNKLDFTLRSETNVYFGWGKPDHLHKNLPKLKSAINTAAKAGFHHFVVSHENSIGRPFLEYKSGIYPDAAESIDTIHEILREYDPLVVYYIRDQPDFVESYYLQTVHQGSYTTFRDWKRDLDLERISWAPVVGKLRERFGKKAIVKDFATEFKGGQNGYLESFFRAFVPSLAPVQFQGFSYDEYKNPSIGKKGLAIALVANQHLSTHKERKLMRAFLQTHFSNQDYPRPALMKEKEKEQLRSRYAQENRRLLSP